MVYVFHPLFVYLAINYSFFIINYEKILPDTGAL